MRKDIRDMNEAELHEYVHIDLVWDEYVRRSQDVIAELIRRNALLEQAILKIYSEALGG